MGSKKTGNLKKLSPQKTAVNASAKRPECFLVLLTVVPFSPHATVYLLSPTNVQFLPPPPSVEKTPSLLILHSMLALHRDRTSLLTTREKNLQGWQNCTGQQCIVSKAGKTVHY